MSVGKLKLGAHWPSASVEPDLMYSHQGGKKRKCFWGKVQAAAKIGENFKAKKANILEPPWNQPLQERKDKYEDY